MNDPVNQQGFQPDDPIEEAAAAWLVQRDEGFTPQQAGEFEQWCRLDPRHANAVARLESTCALLERLPFSREQLLPAEEMGVPAGPTGGTRGIVRSWAAGIAAMIAFAAIAWWQWPGGEISSAQYTTAANGYDQVAMEDGSVMELNAGSAASVHFSAAERRVTLAAGEAHFEVKPDPGRPFIVVADTVSVRAVGTAFSVRLAEAAVEVLVTEGKVSLAPQNPALDGAERSPTVAPALPDDSMVQAGQRATVARHGADSWPKIEMIEPSGIREALAWQKRKLEFVETPLREVVAQFNRRNEIQLIVADDELAERRVGGTFAADNVEAFVRLLESSGDIVASPRGAREILLRRAR